MKMNARGAALEGVGIFTLACATVFFVASSWRRWPDPLIDFGQELYNAWQISNGAVLYRDVGCLYGPLSQYLNAGIFWIFGPGLITMVWANLVVFAAIAAIIYFLFRKSWGPLAAWISVLILISVFGFSQFVETGNYNYAAPYSTETIHGTLLCLLLALSLIGSIEKPDARRDFVCGLLFGGTVVLKPEFIFAAFTMSVLAALARWKAHRLPGVVGFFCWVIGVILPTLVFTIYFARFFPLGRAVLVSSQAWLSVFNSSYNRSYLAISLIGLDHPWPRLVEGLTATALACSVIFALWGATFLANGKAPKWFRLGWTSLILVIFGWLACYVIKWIEIGQCLFGLALIYFFFSIGSFLRGGKANTEFAVRVSRLLIAGLAIALMARMFLNPRIYHYGYYQAAIAALMPPAVMIGELPNWFRKGWPGLVVAAIGTLTLVIPGIAILAIRSELALTLKTEVIGTGRDRFYSFPSKMDTIGEIVNDVIDVLRAKAGDETLTVLPEGESINYFARLRNPVPHACFYKGAMEASTESEVVADLQKQSPYWIVLISRDLIGWGIERYGEKSGSGEEILKWVEQNYKQVGSIGGDPLDYRQRGAIIYRSYSR
jgi:hypothetical protein